MKISYPIGTRTPAPPGRPARSQSLYRLRYPGSYSSSTQEKSYVQISLFFYNNLVKHCPKYEMAEK
jgi:hypothetical protein